MLCITSVRVLLTVHQRIVAKTCINANIVDLQSLRLQLVFELDHRSLDDGAHRSIVRVERRIDRAACGDGNLERQFAKMLWLQADDHLCLFGHT